MKHQQSSDQSIRYHPYPEKPKANSQDPQNSSYPYDHNNPYINPYQFNYHQTYDYNCYQPNSFHGSHYNTAYQQSRMYSQYQQQLYRQKYSDPFASVRNTVKKSDTNLEIIPEGEWRIGIFCGSGSETSVRQTIDNLINKYGIYSFSFSSKSSTQEEQENSTEFDAIQAEIIKYQDEQQTSHYKRGFVIDGSLSSPEIYLQLETFLKEKALELDCVFYIPSPSADLTHSSENDDPPFIQEMRSSVVKLNPSEDLNSSIFNHLKSVKRKKIQPISLSNTNPQSQQYQSSSSKDSTLSLGLETERKTHS